MKNTIWHSKCKASLPGAVLLALLSTPIVAHAELGCSASTAADLGALVDEIASLPEGGWLRVNQNRYEDVWTPQELRSSSGALLSTPAKIIQAWSSFAWDCRRGDLLLYGGGHANYSGNDTYRWRATTRRWERMSLPSDIRVDGMRNTTAIDGPFAAPPAAHTYDNNIYLPVVDRFLVLGGSAWTNGGAFEMETGPGQERITGPYVFDLNKADGAKVGGTTGSHVQRVAAFPEIVGGQMWQNRDLYTLLPLSSLPANHTSGTTAYAGTGNADIVLLTARQGLSTAQHLFRYEIVDPDDATRDRMSRIGRFTGGASGRGAGAFDPDLNVYVRTVIGSSSAYFYFWDLRRAGSDNPNVIFAPRDLSGGWKLDRGYGLDFDPVRGQYLLWGGSGEVWTLRAPATASALGWTLERLPTPSSVDTPSSGYDGVSLEKGGGVLGKWKYIPELDAFLGLQDTSAGNVWLYKPIGWTRPGTPPRPTLSISASPEQLYAGDGVTVTWRTKGASSCVAEGDWSGVKGVQGSQSVLALASNSTYGLRCDGPHGSVRRSVSVTVDPIRAPVITTVAGDSCVNAQESAAGVNVSGTGKAGATVILKFTAISRSGSVDQAGNWTIGLGSSDLQSLPEGRSTLTAVQTAGGNVLSPATEATVTKDTVAPGGSTTPPQLLASSDTGPSASDGLTRDTTPSFQGASSTASTAVALLVDGVPSMTGKADGAGRWVITAKPLANGARQVSAAISDTCGNLGAVTQPLPITVDTVAPALSLSAVAGDNRVNAAEAQQGVEIRGAAESASDISLQISVSGSVRVQRNAVSTGSWSFQLTGADFIVLPEGALTVRVSATDRAGNVRSVTRTITKDTSVATPTIQPIAGDDVLSPSERTTPIVVSGIADSGSGVVIGIDGWTRRVTVAGGGTWSVDLPASVVGQLTAGPVQVTAQATDPAGNVSTAAARTLTVAPTR
jgi:hypothetical protein